MIGDLERDRLAAIELARALAPHLPGWTLETPADDHYWADLVRSADGARMRLRVNEWRQAGRVVFRGCWPKFKDGTGHIHGETVSISFDVKRTPAALARDVVRRFLPAYDRAYADACAYVRSHDEAAAEAQGVATRIAETIEGRLGENKSRRGDGVSIWDEPEAVRRLVVHPTYGVEGTAHYQPVRVDFEVHGLDPETAAEVLRLIKDAEDRARTRARVSGFRIADEVESTEELEPVPAARAAVR